MDINEWNEKIELIYDEFYETIVNAIDCGPFDGGCVVTANALQKVIGGEIVVLVKENNRADHAVVYVNDLLWDFDGPLPINEFINRFNKNELTTCVNFRPIEKDDLVNASRDLEIENKLEILFRKVLENSPKISI